VARSEADEGVPVAVVCCSDLQKWALSSKTATYLQESLELVLFSDE